MSEKADLSPNFKTSNDDQVFNDSLHQLSSLVTAKKIEQPIEPTGNLLFQACQIIGRRMGITFILPSPKTESVEEICEASRIRCRQVVLEKDWEKSDLGPLLVFKKDSKDPLVLMPRGSAYYIIDPKTKEATELHQLGQIDLSHSAYMFYIPLLSNVDNPFKFFLFCLQGNVNIYARLFLLAFLGMLLNLFFPIANKVIFDYVIPGYDITLYVQIVLGLGLCFLPLALFFITRSLLIVKLNGILENRLQLALWDRIMQLPFSFFRKMTTGDLLQGTFVVDILKKNLGLDVFNMLLNAFFSFGYLIIMFIMSWQLTLISLAIMSISMIFWAVLMILKINYERQFLASNAQLNTLLLQILNCLSKIKNAAGEKRFFAKWANEFFSNQMAKLKSQNMQSLIVTFNTTFALLAPLAFFFTVINVMQGSSAASSVGSISIGSFLAFYSAFSIFSQALFDLESTLLGLIGIIPFWERFTPIIRTPLESSYNKAKIPDFQGNIQVKNLFFRYEEGFSFLIQDYSMEIKPGETIFIAGPSGSGKSTLCRLLLGLEKPVKGEISYDGRDLETLDLPFLYKHVGAVLQTSDIFLGTIYDNVTCGRKYSPEHIQKALEDSTFLEELQEFPMGLETLLTSKGRMLSGGQKQKILLARALVENPKMLILDEALNFIDNISYGQIMQNLKKRQMTLIIVTHRETLKSESYRILRI